MIKHTSKILSVVFSAILAMQNILITSFAREEEINTFSSALPSEYSLDSYDFSDGLTSNTINAVAQDSKGYIWIGADNGLYKYNAKNFERICFDNDEYNFSCVSSIKYDNNNNLWIGTSENGLFLLKNNIAVSFDTKGYLSKNITDIDVDINGNVIVTATSGIITVNPQSFDISLMPAELTPADKTILDVCVSANGAVWCITDNSSLYFISGDVKTSIDIDDQSKSGLISDKEPSCLYSDISGRVYVGTESDELTYFDYCDDGTFDTGIIEFADTGSINSIAEDSLSGVWVCSDNGVGFVKNDDVIMVDTGICGRVNCSFADNQGNLWFGTENEGLVKISLNRLVDLSKNAGIHGQIANCVTVYNNLLYIGTDSGLVIYDALENGSVIENDLTALLDNVKINSLLALDNGNLLIGTDQRYGLITYNAGTDSSWNIFNSENGLDGERVLSISSFSPESIVVGTEKSVCVIENNALKNKYSLEKKVNSVACDQSGNIYAATTSGAYVIRQDQALLLNEKLAELNIYDIYAVDSDNVIICADKASYLYSQNSLVDISGSFDEHTLVVDVLCDENSNLIFAAADGIYTITLDELKSKQKCRNYNGIQDIDASLTLNSQCCYMNKVLYVCTIDGVVAVKERVSDYQPSLVINSIKCDGNVLDLSSDKTIKLDSNVKNIVIDASVLSFTGDNNLSYMLEGFDENYITADSSELIRYTNLNGGKYTLKIYGTDSDGIKTEVVSIKFSKQNIWYESPIFWIVVIISVAVISFLISMFYIAEKLSREENLQAVRSDLSIQSIMAVSETIDSKSNVSKGHSKRVAQYSVEIAKRLKCDDDFIERLYLAALLHDIGNIGVSDEILKKPHKLTPEEIKIMQKHVQTGDEILREHEALRELADAVLYHHERYDGIGYMKKLVGEDIPLSSRIILASESLDAMQTEKAYRPKLTRERIINEFRVGSGTQFDPDIAQIVIKMIESGYSCE